MDKCRNLRMRMLGYAFVFVVHVSNLVFMESVKDTESSTVTNDPRIKKFRELHFRYFTCWTVFTQILNSITGFTCDTLVLKNFDNKMYTLPKHIRKFRDILFAGVVWPCTMVVSTVFWSLYIYDRSLIYPEFLDKILSPVSNHILHTLIVPIVIGEVMLRKREKPHSHARYIQQLLGHMAVYLTVFYYTYFSEGIWLYPIFEVTYGTIHFLTLHLVLASLFCIFYYLQWYLNDLFHAKIENKMEKVK